MEKQSQLVYRFSVKHQPASGTDVKVDFVEGETVFCTGELTPICSSDNDKTATVVSWTWNVEGGQQILLKGLPNGFNKDANKKGAWREKCEITGIKSKGFAIISSVPETNDKEHAWQTRKSLEDIREMESAAAERLRSLQSELFSRTKERDELRKKLNLKLGSVVPGRFGGLGSEAGLTAVEVKAISVAAGAGAATETPSRRPKIDLDKEFDVDASLYPVPAPQVDAKIKEGLERYGREVKSINEELVRPIVEMRNAVGRSGDESVQVVVTAAHQSCTLSVCLNTTFREILEAASAFWAIPGEDKSTFQIYHDVSGDDDVERYAILTPNLTVEQVARPVGESGPLHVFLAAVEVPTLEQMHEYKPENSPEYKNKHRNKKRKVEDMAYEPSDENKELLSDLPKTVLLLMACIMLIFLRRSVLEFYYVNSSVRADTVDVFFGPGLSQSFDSINTLNGIWAWLEGPMYDAVKGATEANERRKTLRLSQGIGTLRSNVTLVDNYDNGTYVNTTNYTTYYNLTAKPPETSYSGTLWDYNMMFGKLRLRQLRTTDRSCQLSPGKGITFLANGECRGYYDILSRDEASTWPGEMCSAQNASAEVADAFVFRDVLIPTPDTQYEAAIQLGRLAVYDPSGYFVDVPIDPTKWKAALAELRACKWLDSNTRALILNFNVFNPNFNLYTGARITFEVGPTGTVYPMPKTFTLRADTYGRNGNYIIALEAILFVAVVLKAHEIYKRYKAGNKQEDTLTRIVSNSYELLDVLLVGMFLASALFHIVWVYIIDDALKATTTYGVLSVTSPHYFELAAKAWWFETGLTFDSVVIIFALCRATQVFQAHRSTSVLIWTLFYARGAIIAFITVFSMMFMAFVVLAHNIFGTHIHEYSTLTRTSKNLMMALLGHFSYDGVRDDEMVWALATFLPFVFLFYFVLLSVFLAILNESMMQATLHADEHESLTWKQLEGFIFNKDRALEENDEDNVDAGDDDWSNDAKGGSSAAPTSTYDVLSMINIDLNSALGVAGAGIHGEKEGHTDEDTEGGAADDGDQGAKASGLDAILLGDDDVEFVFGGGTELDEYDDEFVKRLRKHRG